MYYGNYVDVSIGVSAHSFTVSVYTARTLLVPPETSEIHRSKTPSNVSSLYYGKYVENVSSLIVSVYTSRTLIGATSD